MGALTEVPAKIYQIYDEQLDEVWSADSGEIMWDSAAAAKNEWEWNEAVDDGAFTNQTRYYIQAYSVAYAPIAYVPNS